MEIKRNLWNGQKHNVTANPHLMIRRIFRMRRGFDGRIKYWWMLLPGGWCCFSNSRWWTFGRWRRSRWWKMKETLRIIHSFLKCLYIFEHLFHFNIKTLIYRNESIIIFYSLLFIFSKIISIQIINKRIIFILSWIFECLKLMSEFVNICQYPGPECIIKVVDVKRPKNASKRCNFLGRISSKYEEKPLRISPIRC